MSGDGVQCFKACSHQLGFTSSHNPVPDTPPFQSFLFTYGIWAGNQELPYFQACGASAYPNRKPSLGVVIDGFWLHFPPRPLVPLLFICSPGFQHLPLPETGEPFIDLKPEDKPFFNCSIHASFFSSGPTFVFTIRDEKAVWEDLDVLSSYYPPEWSWSSLTSSNDPRFPEELGGAAPLEPHITVILPPSPSVLFQCHRHLEGLGSVTGQNSVWVVLVSPTLPLLLQNKKEILPQT